MKLSIIVVSYNTSLLLQNCLQKILRAITFGGLEDQTEIIVIDNASTDDSCKVIKDKFPHVLLIANKENLGFAKANNQGIKKARGKFILLLNSDTEVKIESLSLMLGKLEKNREIGVLGPKLVNPDDSLQQSVGYFPSLLKVFFWISFIDDLPILSFLLKPYHMKDKDFYKKEQEVDWISGACVMVRSEAIGRAGFLDEEIFMYGEEVEWCYRIKGEGFKVLYMPKAVVTHVKGGSGIGGNAGIVEEFASIIYFYKKHKKNWKLFLLKLFLMFVALFRLILFGIIGANSIKAKLYAKAILLSRR